MMLQLAQTDIAGRSFWLQQALAEDNELQPSLAGEIQADICIVGGGYLGLWSAIQLKDHDPSLKIVVLEKDICGGGPSGRNSGMLLSAWPKAGALAELRGEDDGLDIFRRSLNAIGEIARFCSSE